jgi:hypothetical protein
MKPLSAEAERIEVVFFKRDPPLPNLAKKYWKPVPPVARDQWVSAGSFQSNDWPEVFCIKADGQLVGAIDTGNSELRLSVGPGEAKYASNPQPSIKKLLQSTDGGRTWLSEPMNLPVGGVRG